MKYKTETNELEKSGREVMRAHLAKRIAAIENRQMQFCGKTKDGSSVGPTRDIGRVDHYGAKQIAQRISLGIEEIDRALDPNHGRGIEFAGLHEIRSHSTLSFAAAAGFALVLGNHLERSRFQHSPNIQAFKDEKTSRATRITNHIQIQAQREAQTVAALPMRPVFWIVDRFCQREAGDFYGPGLYSLGINPGRLIRILPRNFKEVLWAAGEIARGDKIGFALMEVRGNPHKLDLTATRQLLLRCQKSQMPFFILRQAGLAQASAVSTRWLVEPALSGEHANKRAQNTTHNTQYNTHKKAGPGLMGLMGLMGMTTWNVSLEKCRGGKTGNWTLEWNHHEQVFKIPGKISDKTPDKTPGQTGLQSVERQSKYANRHYSNSNQSGRY